MIFIAEWLMSKLKIYFIDAIYYARAWYISAASKERKTRCFRFGRPQKRQSNSLNEAGDLFFFTVNFHRKQFWSGRWYGEQNVGIISDQYLRCVIYCVFGLLKYLAVKKFFTHTKKWESATQENIGKPPPTRLCVHWALASL